MICPKCQHDATLVLETRHCRDGRENRRRRKCPRCAHQWTTFEIHALKLKRTPIHTTNSVSSTNSPR